MAFVGASVHEITKEIQDRELKVGRLALVVAALDAKEISDLRSQVRRIVRGCLSGIEGQTLVMAFSLWICNRRISSQQAFWEEFEHELGLNTGENRNFIYNDLLEPAFFRHDITLWMIGGSRRFVTSLMDERQSALATLAQVVSFFVWYFRNSLGVSVSHELFAHYQRQTGNNLPIAPQAFDALSDDCQKLTQIVQVAIENEVFLSALTGGWDDYCSAIVALLGHDFNPSRLRIVRNSEVLRRIISDLQNHRTPVQFLRELERFSNASVQLPDSRSLSVSTFRTWRASEVTYGIYNVRLSSNGGSKRATTMLAEYRVVPCTWTPLETLKGWPFAKIISLRASWLGYRKIQPFTVKLDGRELTSRLCYFQDGSSTNVWVGEIVAGRRMIVDGIAIPQAQGLSWEIALRLMYDENKAPCLSLVVIKLLAYLPGTGGANVELFTSQGDRELRHMEPDGTLTLYQDVHFDLRQFNTPITVQVNIGTTEKQRTIVPSSAWLFSAYTREAVPPNRSIQQDGRRFVLFCAPDAQPQAKDGVAVTPVESGMAPFRAWRVEWTEGHKPFSLQVGDLSWRIEQQTYFEAWLEPHEPLVLSEGETGLILKPEQRHGFDEQTVRVATNLLWGDAALRCRFLRGDKPLFESTLSEALQAGSGDVCSITAFFARRLNEAVAGSYGQYTLRFLEAGSDEEESERVLTQIIVSIVPRINLQVETNFVSENEALQLQVESRHVPLWNAETQRTDSVAMVKLYPVIRILPPRSIVDAPEDIQDGEITQDFYFRLKGQVATSTVVIPKLGESLCAAALPALFGFRLYQKFEGRKPWEVYEADFFALDTYILHVFTAVRGSVECLINNQLVWQCHPDEDGQAILEGLGAFRPFCQSESTTVTIKGVLGSQLKQNSFLIRWTPRVFDLTFFDGTIGVRCDGPINTAVVLRFESENGAMVEEVLPCTGGESLVSCGVPYLPNRELPRFVTAFGWQGDDNLVPSAHRLVLPTSVAPSASHSGSRLSKLPEHWLRAGVGFSSVAEMNRRLTN